MAGRNHFGREISAMMTADTFADDDSFAIPLMGQCAPFKIV